MSFPAEPITLQSLFGPKRTLGSIQLQVVVDETTNDTLTITKQPVQVGASITDHAFKEPTSLSMTAYFKNNNLITGLQSTFNGSALSELYQQLLLLQISRAPFVITTPKRIYKDMLLQNLRQLTDKFTENCLKVEMTFQQVIIVNVSTTNVPRANQKNPQSNQGTKNVGQKQSGLLSGAQAVNPNITGVSQ